MAIGRWALGLSLFAALVAVPTAHYRATYAHAKRLREVEPGVLYRSGQLTADGFRDAVQRLGIRTVLNVQNEFPDPDVARGTWVGGTVKESQLCRDLGVKYAFISPDLRGHRTHADAIPEACAAFNALMADPANHPVLIHCKAGLHRTGLLCAVYRMEFDGWTPQAAVGELKAHGFGDHAATAGNDYVQQYILNYRPSGAGARGEGRGARKTLSSLAPRPSPLAPAAGGTP